MQNNETFDYKKSLFFRLLDTQSAASVNSDTLLQWEYDSGGVVLRCGDHESDSGDHESDSGSYGVVAEYTFDSAAIAAAAYEDNTATLIDSEDGVRCVVKFYKTVPLTEADLPPL